MFGFQDKKKTKAILEGEQDFDLLEMNGFAKEHREAFLAAIAAIIKNGD